MHGGGGIANEPREYERFVHAQYRPLVRSLTRLTGNRELATDAVQDALLRAYDDWRRVRSLDAPAAWVRRVAINRSRDLVRAERRRRQNEERASELLRPARDTDPALRIDIERLVGSLPERQRIAVTLHYLRGLAVRDVASAMAISESSVKIHLRRGRARLLALLDRPAAA